MITTTIFTALVVMVAVILLLVVLLLLLRDKLLPTGQVTLTINDDRQMEVPTGGTLIATLAEQQVYLPSACGGKGSCGQCKCRVLEGGGSILPTEVGFFTRKQQQEGWRLGCQVKVKEDMRIALPPSILNIKKYECTVVSNRNVATFIKELKVKLPEGEHLDFEPGSYAQIEIPTYNLKFSDFDRGLITDEYLPAWEKNRMFDLQCKNSEPTTRAYSMANYPAEGDVFMLTVRIATPPMKPDRSGFMNVSPGIASSYIFSLREGDKVVLSGPYGDFHIREHQAEEVEKPEMVWVGGGAGMAPLRAQVMHLTRSLHTTDREMHFFYGARALNEVPYLEDFLQLEKDFHNFHFHLALDRPDPSADAKGIAYRPGFVHQVMMDTYLGNHPTPEEVEYYMCGPAPMASAVLNVLDNLGVPPENISYDNFGG